MEPLINADATLYRRHSATCKYRGQGVLHKTCQCPVWYDGKRREERSGKRVQVSLKTNDWKSAQKQLQALIDGEDQEIVRDVTLDEAVTAYLTECKTRAAAGTVARYKNSLDPLLKFLPAGLRLKAITTAMLDQFRIHRLLQAPGSHRIDLTNLKTFFEFAADRKLIPANPARPMKHGKRKKYKAVPFSEAEVERMLAAAKRLNSARRDLKTQLDRVRAEAILRVMLDSGLRLVDTAKLQPVSIDFETGAVSVVLQKNQYHLYTFFTRETLDLLATLPQRAYFFWNGASTLASAKRSIDRTIRAVGKLAGVTGARAHRFRDTFAARFLEVPGNSMEDLQLALGHESIVVTQEHYATVSEGRVRNMQEAVLRTQQQHSLTPKTRQNTRQDGVRDAKLNLLPFARQKAG